MTDNAMEKRKWTKRQTMVDKIKHGKLKTEQHEPHKKWSVNQKDKQFLLH
jgi:hypothetical protein